MGMMFFRKSAPKQQPASAEPPKHRLAQIVREARDRPTIMPHEPGVAEQSDVMALLVELRAAGKRGHESAAARDLGPEFNRYLGAFYNLPPELQAPAIEGLLRSRQREEKGDLEGAIQACESALEACPNYLPLLDRLATLEMARGAMARAEVWYGRLLAELDRLNFYPDAHEICHRLIEADITNRELLERCARRLEAEDDLPMAARCWARRAALLTAEGFDEDALAELDRAIMLQPENAAYRLELALLYERLGEMDRAALTFEQAESLGMDDPETLIRVMLIRARVSAPDRGTLDRLVDLLENRPRARQEVLRHCAEAVAASPYNPHLSFIEGIVLAQDGQTAPGIEALRIAVDRYSAQSDRTSELAARLTLRQLEPRDAENGRRIAELYFERGDVRLAMQTLGSLAKTTRR